MAVVRQRSPQQVKALLQAIVQDVEPIVREVPVTYEAWRAQLVDLDAWQAVVLGNVCDLLPGEVRDLVLRFQAVRETVLYRDWSQGGE